MAVTVREVPQSERYRFRLLATHFKLIRKGLRYVDYRQAERDCEALAEQLLSVYTARQLGEFRFVAIPRGGFIVLGMLAYLLKLKPEQLEPADGRASRPVCVVDDCALSGLRFSQTLAKIRSDHVVFAHLYSHPNLRKSLLDNEPRVAHCLAARDVEDFAVEQGAGAVSSRLQAAWNREPGSARYWTGATEVIAFAWSEPNTNVIDPASGELESRWRFISPHQCLKNRAELGVPPHAIDSISYQVPASAVTGWFDGVALLLKPDTKQAYRLDGVGADMWRALAALGDIDAAVNYLHQRLGTDRAVLERDLQEFAEQLLREGLLERAG